MVGAFVDAIARALAVDRSARLQRGKLAELGRRYHSLAAREREVMVYAVKGMLNKQVADELGTTEKAIKAHRGHIMQKMVMKSLTDLVRAAERLGLSGHTA